MSGDRRRWDELPGEIRNAIVDYLPFPGEKGSLLAPVCREWQSMIEPHNFAEISLTIPRLADPSTRHILFRKRYYIRRICFYVQERFNQISVALGPANVEFDPSTRNAFEGLFAALSTWEPRGDLVLSINPRSMPSPMPTLEDTNIDPVALTSDHKSEPLWWRGLPSVPAVGVVLIHPPPIPKSWNMLALSSMFTRFPNMQELCYQGSWSYALPGPLIGRPYMSLPIDPYIGDMFLSLARTILCKLTILPRTKPKWDFFQDPNKPLGRKIARASLLLTSLSASFLFDANLFFAARQADWLWERLTYLALTMDDIYFFAEPFAVNEIILNRLFRHAVTAALYMPRLETMELWNGSKGRAILFRYQKAQDGRSAVITVRGSFELPLEAEVIDAWEKVAHRHRHGNLIIQTSLVHPSTIRDLKSSVQELGLSAETARHFLGQQGEGSDLSMAWYS